MHKGGHTRPCKHAQHSEWAWHHPYMLALHCGSERKSALECTAQCTTAALIATKSHCTSMRAIHMALEPEPQNASIPLDPSALHNQLGAHPKSMKPQGNTCKLLYGTPEVITSLSSSEICHPSQSLKALVKGYKMGPKFMSFG